MNWSGIEKAELGSLLDKATELLVVAGMEDLDPDAKGVNLAVERDPFLFVGAERPLKVTACVKTELDAMTELSELGAGLEKWESVSEGGLLDSRNSCIAMAWVGRTAPSG